MDNLTYEEAFNNLESIINELDSGELSLEESINKYEEGLKLYNFCQEFLKSVEGRIEIITKEGIQTLESELILSDDDYEE